MRLCPYITHVICGSALVYSSGWLCPSIHLHHINRNQRYCIFCTQNHNINTVEDEEHVLFHCPEYDTCRQEFPDLLLGNMSIKNVSEFDNQETIAKLLRKIRMIRIKLGAEC